EYSSQGWEVVTVTALHVPTEGGELPIEVAQIGDLRDQPVCLKFVVVYDDGEVRHTLLDRRLKGLVVLPLLKLAVANEHEHAPAELLMAFGPRDATRLGDPHTE